MEWVGEVLADRRPLPSAVPMRASIERDEAIARRRHEPRFGYLVDRVAYIRAMEREARRPRAPEAATL